VDDTPKPKNLGGRPKKDIDPDMVRRLAAIGCTNREIGAWFDCDEGTIRHRFSDVVAQGKEHGKTSLRRLQWKRAYAGSDTMLIHLGKNVLGQSEKIDQTVHNEPVVVEVPPKNAEDQSTAGTTGKLPGEFS
jgi:hypothetical protein